MSLPQIQEVAKKPLLSFLPSLSPPLSPLPSPPLSLLQQLEGAWPGADGAGWAFALPTSSRIGHPLPQVVGPSYTGNWQNTNRTFFRVFTQFHCLKCITIDLLFLQGPFKWHPFYEGFISLDKINLPTWCPWHFGLKHWFAAFTAPWARWGKKLRFNHVCVVDDLARHLAGQKQPLMLTKLKTEKCEGPLLGRLKIRSFPALLP